VSEGGEGRWRKGEPNLKQGKARGRKGEK